MVGREDIPIIRLSNHDDKNDNSTYSMRKEKKKADIQMSEEYSADNEVDNGDYMKLVDNFVQGVIERAKQEYLGSCANSGVETGVRQMNEEDRLLADADKSRENERLKKSAENRKGSSGRRKPHYKYSGPVDEREISGYESPEASSLLNKRSEFELEDTMKAEHRTIYERVAAALRRLLSCCAGKTWSP